MPLPYDLSQHLQRIITSLINLQSSSSSQPPKRYYSALFQELPDKHLYADYYVFIKEPRSLNGILDSLNRNIYSSPLAVAYDLFLVWSNAREYNQQGSQVYNDADKLESYMGRLWNEHSPPLPDFSRLLRPDMLNSKPSTSSAAPTPATRPAPPPEKERKLKKIKISMPSATSSPAPPPPRPQPPPPAPAPTPASIIGTPAPMRASANLRMADPAPPPAVAPATPSHPPLTLKLAFKPPVAPSTPHVAPTPQPPPPSSIAGPSNTPSSSAPSTKIRLGSSSLAAAAFAAANSSAGSPAPFSSAPSTSTVTAPTPQPVATSQTPIDPNAPTPAELAAAKAERRKRKDEKKAKEKAAKIALKKQEKEAAELAAAEAAALIPKGIPDVDSGWMGGEAGSNPISSYLEIVRKLKEHTDASGRVLATPLLTLPDRDARPDYYEKVQNPVALDTIEAKASSGQYASPEAFDRDLHHLFMIHKLFISRDTPGPAYTDFLVLQRLYHELTKRVSPLAPPSSLDLTSLASVSSGPGNLPANGAGAGADATAEPTFDADGKQQVGSRMTVKDKVFLEGINFKGEVYKVGDWVHLLNPDTPSKPIIAQIFKAYKRADSPQRCISVCWYYRPEETTHPASRQFYENEVFKTSNFVDHSIEDLVERCFVMFHTRYIRGRPMAPAWNPSMPLYVCEHRYKDDLKSFKKIKNWQSAVPEDIRRHEYDFEPFPDDRIDNPIKIKSPFVRGISGPGGIGQAIEREESEQTKYHFLSSGAPATAQALKEAKAVEEKERRAAAAAADADHAMLVDSTLKNSYRINAAASTALFGTSDAAASAIHRPDLQQSHSTSSIASPVPGQTAAASPAPVVPEPPPAPVIPIGPPPTPAELAIQNESFHPLPMSIQSKFRATPLGDLLWFTAPGVTRKPTPASTTASHSLEYLYWKATKGTKQNGDVEMRDQEAMAV